MSKRKRLLLFVILGAIALVGVNYAMLTIFFGPGTEVRAALRSDSSVQVGSLEENTGLVFSPRAPAAGLILYPEGYQDTRMYAPVVRQIAAQGFRVVLLSRREKFPLSIDEEMKRIQAVMAAYPETTRWFVGAHTWEAGLPARFALQYPQQVTGVVLWAGRLDAGASLAESKLPVLYVYGTLDDENERLLESMRSRLPAQTRYVPIPGGNRVNFANFGPMPRDVGAQISMREQQSQAAAATVSFMTAAIR